MRKLSGHVKLPPDAPETRAAVVRVELRDVSVADAPSTVVAEKQLKNVRISAGGKIPFNLSVPEVAPNRSLNLRVHVDLDGSGRSVPGDLLTTQSYPVAPDADKVEVDVSRL